ncbi:MAG: glycosyltransferase [Brooklawnia sp.]|jgi:rhamnopyranosyl-N-acetylglucosaminyl-diphospho-decaprenol beta-1,3/1,4-galactofuranosyltransferase
MSQAQLGVAAVVVTYNRLSLLQRLIERLRTLEALDAILVVDNASSDGTGEWLAGIAEQDDRLQHRTLPVNAGGAGGFQAGLQWAHDLGAELAWMMDDDGLPTPDCLNLLLTHRGEFDFWGPAVLAEQRPEELCFPIRLPGTATVARTLAELERVAVDGIVADVVIPFNGVLVTRELVDRIGSVRAEFFIWGDDVEYLWRARDAGARVATVVDAHFHHPATDDLGTPMLRGLTTYNHSPSDLKHYCMARNNTVNLLTHRGLPHALAFWAKTAWFYSFVRPSPQRLGLSAQAIIAGLRGDFSGHERFLTRASPANDQALVAARRAADPDAAPGPVDGETVAVVVVTYKRAELLGRLLDSLAEQTRPADAIFIVDNSADEPTAEVLAAHADLPLVIDRVGENIGGAGGFHRGLKAAYLAGYDRIWLMDDDVRPAPWALQALLADGGRVLACVREDRRGGLAEKAAVRFDLSNPLRIQPKTATVDSTWPSRDAMPSRVQIENAAFEGFMVHRSVVDAIGYPDPSYFIFYDDCDYVIRARAAGFTAWAVRDALMRRHYDFVQQNDLSSWKGYYMYRNLFAVHYRYGTNVLVRAKPIILALGVLLASPARGGAAEARNVLRALRDSFAMRELDSRAHLG